MYFYRIRRFDISAFQISDSDEGDKITKRDILIGKRKEKKDKKDKEKGYAALEGESSAEESYQSR